MYDLLCAIDMALFGSCYSPETYAAIWPLAIGSVLLAAGCIYLMLMLDRVEKRLNRMGARNRRQFTAQFKREQELRQELLNANNWLGHEQLENEELKTALRSELQRADALQRLIDYSGMTPEYLRRKADAAEANDISPDEVIPRHFIP